MQLRPKWYNVAKDTSQLHNLPANQKLKIVFELGDDIAASKEPIKISPSVVAEIDRRLAEFDADPNIAIDEDEMWRRVDDKAS